MKIRNVSHLDLDIFPRGTVESRVTVKAGAVIDLEPEVAGTPPLEAYLAATVAARGVGDEDPERAGVIRTLGDQSQMGSGLLAQHDVWQVAADPKKKSKDEEGAA